MGSSGTVKTHHNEFEEEVASGLPAYRQAWRPSALISPKNMKKYRDRLGISQNRLSKIADVTLQTMTKRESGAISDPRIETLRKIAAALGVKVDDFLT